MENINTQESSELSYLETFAELLADVLAVDLTLVSAMKLMAVIDAAKEIEEEKGYRLDTAGLLQKYILLTLVHLTVKRANEMIEAGEKQP